MKLEHGLVEAIHGAAHAHRARAAGAVPGRLNILMLYAEHSCFTPTVLDHLLSFKHFSAANVYYADAVAGAQCNVDLELFDAVVLHYGTGLYHATYFSPSFAKALRGYSGVKVGFAQDEYDWTENLRRRIEELGIHVFYTCIPKARIESIYPRSRFPHVQFVHTLTGYVPLGVDVSAARKPIGKRPIHVGYRGRPLHPKYGLLGRDKLVIGQRMKAICEREGLTCDIAWQEETRIYWDDWFRFLENCRVTLGTESGCNVFDFDGSIRSGIDAELARNPGASFEELYEKHVAEHEGRYGQMNQISPRIFEAMALRTGLVLFEGEYSGIIEPDRHYIALRKDFSNLPEVLEKIRDEHYLSELTERAFQDIIAPGQYSYEAFAKEFGRVIQDKVRAPRGVTLVDSVVAAHRTQTPWRVFDAIEPQLAAEQFSEHVRDTLSVFPVIADPVRTATNWPIFHKEHQAITLKTSLVLNDQVRTLGYELLDGPAAFITRNLGVRPRGIALVLIAILALPYPLVRMLPLRARNALTKAMRAALGAIGAPFRIVLHPVEAYSGFRTPYLKGGAPGAEEPNTVHIAHNLHLNEKGGRLVNRIYPLWASLPNWMKSLVRKPAILAMRFFRAS